MKKILILIISVFALQANAETTETEDELAYESFTCTDEEVEQFIKNESKDSISGFKEFKKAFKDVKTAQAAKKGSGPGGCLTIFDTYDFPKLPDEFFQLDPADLTNIPGLLAKAAMEALEDGYCQVTSQEFIEEQANDALEYYAKRYELKEKGITKLHKPWLPQIMHQKIEMHLTEAKVRNPKDLADVLDYSDPDEQKDNMDDYNEDLTDDFLDEFIPN